jgi:fumarate reductase subunit C
VVPDPADAQGGAVSAELRHTPFHPRWYRRRVSVWWWLKNPAYALFVVRELTSVAVAYFALLLLWQVRALAAGPAAHAAFLERMRSPAFLALNGVALAFVLFHSVTWFNLAPKAMVVRLGGRRVPDALIAGANYAAWLVLSAGVLVVLWRA